MAGLEIQIALKKHRLTQRWLTEQLREQGFKTLHQSHLSNILTGAETGPTSEAVLAKSEEIIKKLDIQR